MKHFHRWLLFLLLAVPLSVLAQNDPSTATITFQGTFNTLPQLLGNAVKAMRLWIIPVVSTVFLLGAFWYVIFAGKEDEVKRGKNMMIKSLIGMSIALMAFALLNVIFFILGI